MIRLPKNSFNKSFSLLICFHCSIWSSEGFGFGLFGFLLMRILFHDANFHRLKFHLMHTISLSDSKCQNERIIQWVTNRWLITTLASVRSKGVCRHVAEAMAAVAVVHLHLSADPVGESRDLR